MDNHTGLYTIGDTTCGYVAIVGRPNVGKSTLLNHILREKVSITSDKPQTTRHRILGVKTQGSAQAIYVDTPGLHRKETHALNHHMNLAARSALREVDLRMFVVEALMWTDEDQWILDLLSRGSTPLMMVVNKSDRIKDKSVLLPYLEQISTKYAFTDILPLSARWDAHLDPLETAVMRYLPPSPHYFPADQKTDRTLHFRMAEIVREKATRSLGAELPYAVSVQIERYEMKRIPHVSALILVEREGQRKILIGAQGDRIKQIGIRARHDIEQILSQHIYLELRVKVRRGWSNDALALKHLGYIES